MENKKLKTLSIAALVVSVLPLTTLVPVFLKLTLPEGVNTAWAGINVVCVVVGLILSIVCVKGEKSRSAVNIASTASAFCGLLMIGIVALALFMTYFVPFTFCADDFNHWHFH